MDSKTPEHETSGEHDHLIQLIYASAATVPFTDEDLQRLLGKARRTNEGLGITGMLTYTDGSFFQVLEGPQGAVEDLFTRIVDDDRHSDVTLIITEAIASRSLAEWTMGYAAVSADDLASISGLNDFFVDGFCLAEIDRGRARKLLEAFKSGRWRQRMATKPQAMSSPG